MASESNRTAVCIAEPQAELHAIPHSDTKTAGMPAGHSHMEAHSTETAHDHHHHEGEACGCGHEHHDHHHHEGEACGCGHEHHDHHHHEGEACGCGHEHHDHHHHEGEACACGHEHHEHDHGAHQHAAGAHSVKRVYTVQNLGCAHCAAEMEHQIRQLDGVEDCVLVYETRQLRVTGADPDALLPQIRAICTGIESEAKVIAPAPKNHGRGSQRVYTIQNLGCAHCAAEMQYQISQLDGVDDCVLVYETKQLRVTGENPDALLPRIREICASIESETRVIAPEEDEETAGGHPLAELLTGAGLFAVGALLLRGWPQLLVMLAAYLLLGRHVLLTAVKNIGRGRVFDENFLMSLATIGAWAIGSFEEAVGVMLFYRVGEYFEDRAVERSRRQIMAAVDLRPETVNRIEADGSVRTLPAEEAQVGDVVLVRPGDRVPLDGEVVRARAGWTPRRSRASPCRCASPWATARSRAASTRTARSNCASPMCWRRAWSSAFWTAWRTPLRASPRSTASSPVFPAFTPRRWSSSRC